MVEHHCLKTKEAMRLAMRDLLNQVKRTLPPGAGTDPKVLVPRRGRKRCTWAHATRRDGGMVPISFSLIIDVIEFDLENCYVVTSDGRLLKQTAGIPMGSALSPALAVGTLAWMEQEWMASLSANTKARFRMGRYMDDVLTVVARNDHEWHADGLLRDFERSECYWSPLTLEAAESQHFLETSIDLNGDGRFRHRLKNVNEGREERPKVWRYHRWDSFANERTKLGVLMGCLLKVTRMASDNTSFWLSLECKMREFIALGYPHAVMRRAAERMYARYGDERWLKAKQLLAVEDGGEEALA